MVNLRSEETGVSYIMQMEWRFGVKELKSVSINRINVSQATRKLSLKRIRPLGDPLCSLPVIQPVSETINDVPPQLRHC